MENKGLCVDYESLDDCIAELDAVYSNQQKVYNKIIEKIINIMDYIYQRLDSILEFMNILVILI